MAGTTKFPSIEPTRRPKPADVFVGPFQRFARLEASGGICLILATIVALAWANSPWGASYVEIWSKTYFTLGVGEWQLSKPIVIWINDLLMGLFFFMVGLEIKREILLGELSSPRKAAIPIAAAIGGMVVPAGIYAAINMGEESIRGWGIPMATDIAFALGVLALLGRRVPLSLRIFLTTLAIVDDLGALAIIAIFYTENLQTAFLGYAAGIMALLIAMNLMGFRRAIIYMLVGLFLWYLVLKSGVHATIAGVLLAATIPTSPRVHTRKFVDYARHALDQYEKEGTSEKLSPITPRQFAATASLKEACDEVQSPLSRLEYLIIPWVAFFIVPVFALSNAGVALDADVAETVGSRVYLGIFFGLLVGKPLGVFLFTWLAVKLKIGELPNNCSWAHIHGAGWLAGIGFTMSLFIANLAFSEVLLDRSKLAILAASLIAGIVGFVLLWRAKPAGGHDDHH